MPLRLGIGISIGDLMYLAASGGGGGSGVDSYRYYSVTMIGTGQQNHVALAQLVGTFTNGATAVLSASETGAGNVANLSDGSQLTKWETTAGFTVATIYMDLGEGVEEHLTSVSLQQTNEPDAVNAHPAGLIIRASNVGGTNPEDYVEYCILNTIVSGVSSDLVTYTIDEDAINGVDYYLNNNNTVWGIIVENPSNGARLADISWRDSGNSPIGTVSSHKTTSLTLNPANLYDGSAATESIFENQSHPQMLVTTFTSALSPNTVQLTGAITGSNSWKKFYIIAGPNTACMQIITEVERTWVNGEVVVINPKKPKAVANNAVIHLLPGDFTATVWNDSIKFGGYDRSLRQDNAANRPTVKTSPTALGFVNTGGTRQWMQKFFASVDANAFMIVYKRPTTNFEGTTDSDGPPEGSETRISGASGGVKNLGISEGSFFETREDFYVNVDGWGQDPLTKQVTQNTWCVSLAATSSLTSVDNISLALNSDGGATVDIGMVLVVKDANATKNNVWNNLRNYARRIVNELEGS